MNAIIETHWAVEGGSTTVVAQAFAVMITATLVSMVWRRREEPTARRLLFVAVGLFVFASGNVLTTIETLPFFDDLGFFRSSIIGGCWVLFALEYTGRNERLERIVKRGLVVLIPMSILLFITRYVLVLFYSHESYYLNVAAVLLQVPLSMTLFVSALLLSVAALRQRALPLGQGGLLAASPILLMVTRSVAAQTAAPIVTPIGIALAAFCVILALSRYRVFETLPVANTASRNQVIESATEAIILVDRQLRLRDYNERAAELFDIDESADPKRPLSEIQSALPEPRRLAALDERVRVQAHDGSLLSVGATEVSNDRDQLFGHTVVIQDVTQQYTREQRLALLNQLLVDVAHHRMAAVARDAKELIEDESADRASDELSDQIWNTTTDLTTLVARTREIEQALAKSEREATNATDIVAIVSDVIDELSDDDSIVYRLSEEQLLALVDETLVEVAVKTLLEDAIEESANAIAVETARLEAESIEIRIDIRTPPDTDTSNVIDELSLQVARLAVDCVGGDVILAETDHTVTIHARLPNEVDERGVVDSDPQQFGGVAS